MELDGRVPSRCSKRPVIPAMPADYQILSKPLQHAGRFPQPENISATSRHRQLFCHAYRFLPEPWQLPRFGNSVLLNCHRVHHGI
ncbi:MAG: hypothetical protein ACYCOR_09690 [Acidobacteriaceae bacterium]